MPLIKANAVREKIIERATAHWDKCERAASEQPAKHASKTTNEKGKGKSKTGGSSTAASSGSQSLTI
ncbi:hypothetical protein PIB30_006646 [Stylosanthes scabra]|uniref:Uncharacterized protein n=1 Tax=Stylosanthes scabra TaxID=79078 RepID=A0ABU6Q4F1_9FABA|nr:hypothetical protein [Stylosanthes scabra]